MQSKSNEMNAEYNTELDIAASYFPSSAGEKHL